MKTMDRKIIFKGREGRFDVPSFTLSDNENLRIEIGLPLARNAVYYFVARHGNELKRIALTGKPSVELTADWLNRGGTAPIVCELELRDRSGVVVYKKYNIEPLEIKGTDVGMEYFSAVQAVEKEIAELRKEFDEFKLKFNRMENTMNDIPDQIERAKNEAIVTSTGGDVLNA